MGYFNIKKDNELISTGGYFFCHACLVARPLVEQSPDPRYCSGCFEVLKVEAALQPTRKVSWMPKNITPKTAPEATETAPARQDVVSKIQQDGNPPIIEKHGIMQQERGRPRKEGKISRSTTWRREKQGVLGMRVF